MPESQNHRLPSRCTASQRVLDKNRAISSPLLWKRLRVSVLEGQSVAVKLIIEREREIEAFKPEEYWSLGPFSKAMTDPEAKLERKGKEKFTLLMKRKYRQL